MFTKRFLGSVTVYLCIPNDFQGHLVKNGKNHRFRFLSSHRIIKVCPVSGVF